MMGAHAITHSPTAAAVVELLLLPLLFPAIETSAAASMLAFGVGCSIDGCTKAADRKGDSGTTDAMLRLDTAVAAAKDDADAEAEDSVTAEAAAEAAAMAFL